MSINKRLISILLCLALIIRCDTYVVHAAERQTTVQNSQEVQSIDNAMDLSMDKLNNIINYRVGWYKSWGGAYEAESGGICSTGYYEVTDSEYQIYISDSRITISISEYDSSGKWLKYNSSLQNGASFKKQSNTRYITIGLKSLTWGVNIYGLFQQGLQIHILKKGENLEKAIEAYNRSNNKGIEAQAKNDLQFDTIMDDMTAEGFMKKMNVGWNLGNSLDSKASVSNRGCDANLKQELNWGNPYVTKELIDYVAACGFNTIRIPVTWYYNSYIDENGNLRIGQNWLARVEEVVRYALANNMYVILNSHHDQQIFYAGVTDEEMTQVLKNVNGLWKDVAEYFECYDEHLIFEAYNEVDNLQLSWNYGDLAAAQVNQMNQVFVDTVRATGGNNTKRILMIPTLLDGTDSRILNAFTLPKDSAKNRLIVQVHSYSQKFHQGLESNMEELEKLSDRIGVPVLIGEFGTNNSYALPELRTFHASNFVARAAEHGIKCIWWDNGSNYAIINRRDFASSNAEMIQALLTGAQGYAYFVEEEKIFNNASQFELKMPNLQTGAVEEQYWGTIITGLIEIPQDTVYCALSLKAVGEASDLWLQRVVFYDEDKNFLGGKELQKGDYACEKPENAEYMRVSINSPFRSTKMEQYSRYLRQGLLELRSYSVSFSNISPKQLIID